MVTEHANHTLGEDGGRDPFNQNFRKFRSKTQWIGSVQPEKFRKNWSTFGGGPFTGRTGWNFGRMDRARGILDFEKQVSFAESC